MGINTSFGLLGICFIFSPAERVRGIICDRSAQDETGSSISGERIPKGLGCDALFLLRRREISRRVCHNTQQ
jgi:hypothetical protein